MRSFLGVPIVAASGIVGAIYLTDKVGAEAFDEADQQLIEMLSSTPRSPSRRPTSTSAAAS
jgi:GAF domain-containing protein